MEEEEEREEEEREKKKERRRKEEEEEEENEWILRGFFVLREVESGLNPPDSGGWRFRSKARMSSSLTPSCDGNPPWAT